MKTKKELILESFKTMNADMLEILLEDSRTYQDARKEVFLGKLDLAFSKLKASGDTFLNMHKGFCNSNICPNRGCNGYSFLGNTSKKHIDLIFDETNDDVKDIYHCDDFETADHLIDKENLISIEILRDEEADFEPSVDFLIESRKYKLAYEELMHFQNSILDKEVYLDWLDEYYPLYESIGARTLLYSEFNKFYWLYTRLSELKKFLESNNSAKEALNDIQNLDTSNDELLLRWLTRYEQTGEELTLFLYEEIDFEQPDNSDFFEVDGLKINSADFKYLSSFKFLFDKYYWDMLKKYTTFSEEEIARHMSENGKMAEKISSLTYHLKKRGFEL